MKESHAKFAALALSSKLHPRTIKQVCEHTGWDPEKTVELLQSGNTQPIKGLAKNSWVDIFDESYPKVLKEITDPPPVLFYRGDIGLLNVAKKLSIVGSRKASQQALTATKLICQQLVHQNFITVSGLAVGVDAAAHEATLNAGGKTIAVLPGSVDAPVPLQNERLALRIIENGGLLVSEMPAGSSIHKGSFPRRNRIIAGLGQATLITSAGSKSGALITARLACSYGREVFALPGAMSDQSMQGNNMLIKRMMASLVESAEDITIAMGYKFVKKHQQGGLSNAAQMLWKSLQSGPKTIDEICYEFDKPVSHALSLLTEMQLEGAVFVDEQLRYCIVKK